MRKITTLQPADNFILYLEFDKGEKKIFDLKPFLKLPAFKQLNNPEAFKKVINKHYFIEWTSLEIDLSADTLWHESK